MGEIIFVSGIGTGVGKTVVSAILTEALHADYWKPVQAGSEETDTDWVRQRISNTETVFHPEIYLLQQPASPHIAAANEGKKIDLQEVIANVPKNSSKLIIEGPGGLLVPLNENEFVIDLIAKLNCKVILVSRNYLGSINHSLLSAEACASRKINVIGWIFNDQYLNYEEEIVKWTGIPRIASIPFAREIDKNFVLTQASAVRNKLGKYD